MVVYYNVRLNLIGILTKGALLNIDNGISMVLTSEWELLD